MIPGQKKKATQKEILPGQLLKEKQAKASALLLKIGCKVKLMKIFLAKSDRLKALLPVGFIQILKGKSDLNSCLKFSFRFLPGHKFFLKPRRARCLKKSAGQQRKTMTKITAPVMKPTNGGASKEENAVLAAAKSVLNPEGNTAEVMKPIQQIEPEKPVIPAPEPRREMTMMEKILKVENLQLVVEKRAKLVQTRSELERFQISSNDFNCSMRLNDSDGNVFTTSFTPGIKKVIDFLKSSFDASITDVENKITF